MIRIYTDGSYSVKTRRGCWSYFIDFGEGLYDIGYGHVINPTSQRAELAAASNAIWSVENSLGDRSKGMRIVVYSDSEYLVKGMNQWIANWKSNGWKLADGRDVKNKDIWEQLSSRCENLSIEWRWIKGHNGNAGNTIVDAISSYIATNRRKD